MNPEEIKYALENCTKYGFCPNCPYEHECDENALDDGLWTGKPLMADALVYIQQLEQRNAYFAEHTARLEARVKDGKNLSTWVNTINPPKNTSDYLVNVWVGYPDGISGMELRSAVYNTVTKQWTVHHDRLEAISIPTHWQELPSPPHGGKHD